MFTPEQKQKLVDDLLAAIKANQDVLFELPIDQYEAVIRSLCDFHRNNTGNA